MCFDRKAFPLIAKICFSIEKLLFPLPIKCLSHKRHLLVKISSFSISNLPIENQQILNSVSFHMKIKHFFSKFKENVNENCLPRKSSIHRLERNIHD